MEVIIPNNFADPIAELEKFYKGVNAACEGDEAALKRLASENCSNSELEIARISLGTRSISMIGRGKSCGAVAKWRSGESPHLVGVDCDFTNSV